MKKNHTEKRKPENRKPEPSKTETAKMEASGPETAKTETTKGETPKAAETAGAETPKAEPSKTETAKAETAGAETPKTEPRLPKPRIPDLRKLDLRKLDLRKLDMRRVYLWGFTALVAVIIAAFGFTFTVREGTGAMVSRFGEIRSVYREAGLRFKLPWPFEQIITYDTRSQYLDSGYTETLTNDKKNVILQTYVIWHIEDLKKYHMSIGSTGVATDYLNDLVANAKNGVMGGYTLSNLVSTTGGDLRVDEISGKIEAEVRSKALDGYGIAVESLRIKRLALPDANVQSVLEQMTADRQKFANELLAEGQRDASIITSEANAEAAKIIADGKLKAAEINAETERQVAAIYREAYEDNADLFIFLKKLMALENSVNENTVVILPAEGSPFDILENMES